MRCTHIDTSTHAADTCAAHPPPHPHVVQAHAHAPSHLVELEDPELDLLVLVLLLLWLGVGLLLPLLGSACGRQGGEQGTIQARSHTGTTPC